MDKCKFCGSAVQCEWLDPLNTQLSVNCPTCGKYIITDTVVNDNRVDKSNFYKVSSWIREQNDLFKNVPKINMEQFEKKLSMKDKKIKEKFDLMMKFLEAQDDNYQLDNELIVKCWIKDRNEAIILFEKALKEFFIKGKVDENIGAARVFYFGITYEGKEYLESLEEVNKSSKNIFVAFNFEESLNEIFNTYVKEAVEELGFNYVVVNQNTTEHNKAISDEIIAKLKSSRIVIADFTNHRNSVYFEAGFAMGIKIPIIWTCQEGHTEALSFDTRQYPHLVWKDGEDLKEQIINRLKVIL